MRKTLPIRSLSVALAIVTMLALVACTSPDDLHLADPTPLETSSLIQYQSSEKESPADQLEEGSVFSEEELTKTEGGEGEGKGEERQYPPPADLTIINDFRAGFIHGDKSAAYQKYIVLHDTEGTSSPANVISWWDSNGNRVASHFIVGMDGSVYQCVPLDKIAHHAGYGNTGHNAYYGITEDGRDDMVGSAWVGNWASDYGMNAWSIGIEMVHVGGSGYYPQAQLDALDSLIAYIDSYYGFESTIIDHKAWRSGNSDTSPEFSGYLANYQSYRRHG